MKLTFKATSSIAGYNTYTNVKPLYTIKYTLV